MTKNDGESISAKEIKNSIREIITSENSNKPIMIKVLQRR